MARGGSNVTNTGALTGNQKPRKEFTIEGATIMYRNFEGRIGDYNREGKKSFAVVLTPEFAAQAERDGWNVNWTKEREEGDEIIPFMNVKVNFKYKAPRVILVTSTGMNALTEHSVGMLDDADIVNVDLTCVGSDYNVNGKEGISCYLKTMYVTINEDELDKKYAYFSSMNAGDGDD